MNAYRFSRIKETLIDAILTPVDYRADNEECITAQFLEHLLSNFAISGKIRRKDIRDAIDSVLIDEDDYLLYEDDLLSLGEEYLCIKLSEYQQRELQELLDNCYAYLQCTDQQLSGALLDRIHSAV